MQCSYCKGKDFDSSSYGYFVCKSCGKLHYDEKQGKVKSGNLNELYFAIGAGAVVVIIVILILLFVTAANKRHNTDTGNVKKIVTEQKK